MEGHASVIQTRIDVGARVTTYRTEMDDFFGRLLADEDPTRIATMAEMMPEPPSLAEVAASILGVDPAPFATPSFQPAPFPAAVSAGPEAPAIAGVRGGPDAPAVIDLAPAEAEAAALSADIAAEPEGPSSTQDHGTRSESEATASTRPVAERTSTRVVVLGLVSVASIAAFKREINRTAGVVGIGVVPAARGLRFPARRRAGAAKATTQGLIRGSQDRDCPGFSASGRSSSPRPAGHPEASRAAPPSGRRPARRRAGRHDSPGRCPAPAPR